MILKNYAEGVRFVSCERVRVIVRECESDLQL